MLVVDDDPAVRLAIGETLACNFDVHVVYARDAASTMHVCHDNRFDLSVLDLCLPDVSGVVVARRLRAQGVDTPILFLTGNAAYVEAASLVELQPAALLSKPFNQAELIRLVRWLCPSAATTTLEGPAIGVH